MNSYERNRKISEAMTLMSEALDIPVRLLKRVDVVNGWVNIIEIVEYPYGERDDREDHIRWEWTR